MSGLIRVLSRTVIVLVLLVLVTIGLVAAFGSDASHWVRIGATPDLKKDRVVFDQDRQIYVAFRHGNVAGVYAKVRTAAGIESVSYCALSGMFESDNAKFDWQGRYYGGAAASGLRTYPARIRGDAVEVDISAPRVHSRTPHGEEPFGPFCPAPPMPNGKGIAGGSHF